MRQTGVKSENVLCRSEAILSAAADVEVNHSIYLAYTGRE
jgi:hypothetical protein